MGKQTAQSSTYANGYGMFSSNLAVDGNKGTKYIDKNYQPQCAHTATGYGDWWRVDFGETMLVSRVAFTNRGDCCWERMADFEIRVQKTIYYILRYLAGDIIGRLDKTLYQKFAVIKDRQSTLYIMH